MTMVLMTGLAMTRERERGTFENLLATPALPIEVMTGKIVPYILIGLIQVSLIIAAALLLFDVPMQGNALLLYFVVLIFIAANLTLGITFSSIARNQLQAMQMTFFFFLPSILLSGFMFPFRGMPEWAQWLGVAAAAYALPAPRARHHAQGQQPLRPLAADLADPALHGGGDRHRPAVLQAHARLESTGESVMPGFAKKTKATVIPALRCRDAPAAIEWLCNTFGFEKHLVVPNDDGTIAHAQLSFGNGMIMLSSVPGTESEFGRLMKQPDEIGGAETQCAYIVVNDADAVYARAKAAGAKIATAIKDEDYGGRGFSCYDPEGHLWSFGTYDPW